MPDPLSLTKRAVTLAMRLTEQLTEWEEDPLVAVIALELARRTVLQVRPELKIRYEALQAIFDVAFDASKLLGLPPSTKGFSSNALATYCPCGKTVTGEPAWATCKFCHERFRHLPTSTEGGGS